MTEKEKLIENLIEKSGKSREDIEKLVSEKVEELSGLVSEEGAIYIIANELGVRLESEKPKRDVELVKIESIKEPKVPVSLICKVIKKYDKINFSSGQNPQGCVQSLFVGDETGVSRVSFWNENADLLEDIKEGDVLKIVNAYTRANNTNPDRIDVHFGQYSDLEVNPEGVEITLPEFKGGGAGFDFKEKKISDLADDDKNVKVVGVITDFEIPRFYLACPKTFKKVFQDEGKYISPTEGEVDPVKVPIVNVVIDDGSGTIGVVGFRNRAEDLTKISSDEIIGLTEDIEKYKDFSKKIVGAKIEVGGNVSLNSVSGEKQVLANQILEVDFKTVDEIAKELVSEDKKEEKSEVKTEEKKKEETEKKEEKKEEKEEVKEEKKEEKKEKPKEVEDDMDIDIEEIDIDDDLL